MGHTGRTRAGLFRDLHRNWIRIQLKLAGPLIQLNEMLHFEFLAEGDVDPRPEVARTLIEKLRRDSAPVLIYSSYERTCLRNMAICVPELAGELEAIVERLVDLLPIVKAHVYHPDLLGSFSIKKVGPAFAPHVIYSDLEGVSDGTAAFAKIVGGDIGELKERALRAELRASGIRSH